MTVWSPLGGGGAGGRQSRNGQRGVMRQRSRPSSKGSGGRRRLAVFLTVLAWPAAAAAYRPFDGTDAAIVDKGVLEIELGPLGYLREASAEFVIAPAVVLNWGFSSRWEVVLEGANVFTVDGVPGRSGFVLEDTGLFLKGMLREGSLQGASGPSIATEFGVLLPTISGEPGTGLEALLIVSQSWDALTLHLNGAIARTRSKRRGLFGGIILEGPQAWTVRPVAELYVESEGGAPNVESALAGAIWSVRDGLSVDVGFRYAWQGHESGVEVRGGFTWAFSTAREP